MNCAFEKISRLHLPLFMTVLTPCMCTHGQALQLGAIFAVSLRVATESCLACEQSVGSKSMRVNTLFCLLVAHVAVWHAVSNEERACNFVSSRGSVACSTEFTHAMATNGKHASMLRGQRSTNERHLKRNMSSVCIACTGTAECMHDLSFIRSPHYMRRRVPILVQ